jgi:N-acetylneuraminate 9-O-acetyltransferase
MTTAYNPASVATCMASRSVVFIGDSITRQLFYAMAKIADPSAPDGPATDGEKHKDASFTAQKGEPCVCACASALSVA